jgi:uncharacterized protein
MKKLVFFILFFLPLVALSQPAIPELWGTRIHDEAHVLSPEYIQRLEQLLKAHEDSTSNQIAVLIIPTLEGYPIEEYTLKVVETWKLGKKGNDNGVLLFAAINDRRARIEVGDGLEGVLPDIICNQIIRNEMAPYFRQDNYEGGILAATTSIIKAIGGEYHDRTPVVRKKTRGGSLVGTIVILIIIILVSIRNRNNRGGGGWSSGGGWFGGWGGGYGGGGGGWSSGGGGGGFSGGGGSFSGGGSSGSW